MKKRVLATLLAMFMVLGLVACGSKSDSKDDKKEETKTEAKADDAEDVELQVFIAASLNTAMTDIAERYEKEHPNVKIVYNADSSGTLLTQIEEASGNGIDIFFSAGQSQMDTLESDGLVVDGTRHDVLNNQVCVITYPGSGTAVTGLENIGEASSIAMADGSVPVGRYTRQAMINAGMLQGDDPAAITTAQVSQALGGVEINECANVSKVLQAVAEHSNEVGTTYYSDTYGYEDQVEILE